MSDRDVSGLCSVQLQPDPPLWCVVVFESGAGGNPVAVHGPYTDVRLALRDAMVRNTVRSRPPGTLLAALARLEPPTGDDNGRRHGLDADRGAPEGVGRGG